MNWNIVRYEDDEDWEHNKRKAAYYKDNVQTMIDLWIEGLSPAAQQVIGERDINDLRKKWVSSLFEVRGEEYYGD